MDQQARTDAVAPQATPAATPDPILESLQRAEQAAKLKRLHEAAGICRDVLERAPDHLVATAMLGAILGQQGDVSGGLALLQAAVARHPGNAAWQNNLSSLFRLELRLDEALAAGQEAVRLAPGNVGFLLNLGKVHMDRADYDRAMLYFFTVLGREPDNAEAHLAIGQMLLMRGDFRPGWVEYDWRNQLEQARGMIPKMGSPVWNGMNLPQGRILLICDQGFGDSLQFCRYIPMVAARCQQVVVGASAELAPLVSRVAGVGACFDRWQDIPRHTTYALMSSLPGILGTELATIPAGVPYLPLDPAQCAEWAARLDAAVPRGRLRVGLTWAGRTTHPNDYRRSLRLAQLAPLLRAAEAGGVALVSLQKLVPSRDAAAFADLRGAIYDPAAELTTFAATAALVQSLDLVITVDSAVAHLAGASGRPVWMLTPTPSDWRWLLDRSDSPWYPTMRLFRQPSPGDWTGAIAAAAAALRDHVATS
jgi:hypothetical protein